MPSSFIEHYTRPVTHYIPSPAQTTSDVGNIEHVVNEVDTPKKTRLREVLVSLEQPVSRLLIENAVSCLNMPEGSRVSTAGLPTVDTEAETLERAIMTKLVVALYSESLDLYLAQSVETEREAEWWAEVERSRRNVAWYFLQSKSPCALCILTHLCWAFQLFLHVYWTCFVLSLMH